MTDPTTAITPPPEADRLHHQAEDWLTKAQSFTVATDDQYREAGAALLAVGALLREADAVFDANIARWHSGHREAIATKKGVTDPLDRAKAALKGAMAKYQHDLLEAQRRDQQRLDESREAERRKLEAETRAQAEAAARVRAEEEAIQRAIEAEAAGDAAAAEAALDDVAPVAPVVVAPVVLPPAPVAPAPVSVAGATVRRRWVGLVTDLRAYLHWVADQPNPLDYLRGIAQGALDTMARERGGANPPPGVAFEQLVEVAAR